MNNKKLNEAAQNILDAQDEGDVVGYVLNVIPQQRKKPPEAHLTVSVDGKLHTYKWDDENEDWKELK